VTLQSSGVEGSCVHVTVEWMLTLSSNQILFLPPSFPFFYNVPH
jgi:hypothetical protein